MIAGKGHEQGQEFAGGRKIPFDDVDRRARGAGAARRSRCVSWDAAQVAQAAGARLLRAGTPARRARRAS